MEVPPVKRLTLALAPAAAVCLAVNAFAQTAAPISDKDRAALVEYLKTTRDQVLAESATLTEAQWTFKTAPDRWSVGEVVQHLALAESLIFDMQQKQLRAPAASIEQLAATKGKDEMVRKMIPDRTKKVQAPEPLQPTAAATLGGQAATIEAFRERRTKTIDYVAVTKDDLRGHVANSPLGPLDAYQWLLYMAAHSERHLAQIKEVKADPKFLKAASD